MPNAKSYQIHITDRERLAVLLHCRSGVYAPKGHEEQAALFELLEVLQLDVAADDLDDGVPHEVVQRAHGSRTAVAIFDLPKASVEFFLGKLTEAVNVLPIINRSLWPVVERLKSAKRGEYVIPETVKQAIAERAPAATADA